MKSVTHLPLFQVVSGTFFQVSICNLHTIKVKQLLLPALCFVSVACDIDHAKSAGKEMVRQKQGEVAAAPSEGTSSEEVTRELLTFLSPNFNQYASSSMGDDDSCVTGATTNNDGMNQQPAVYAVDGKKNVKWSRQLDLPADVYQGRATHCTYAQGAVFVLVQSDTQPQQTLSQTLLSVAKLDAQTGRMRENTTVAVPDVAAAYSAWVDKGVDHFQWRGDVLAIRGNYFLLSHKEERLQFQVNLNQDLELK